MVRLFGLGSNPKTFEFRCASCGRIHRGSPSFGYDKPAYNFDVPEAERDARVKVTKDICEIWPPAGEEGDTYYFIRGLLEVPITGVDEPFLWGVWVTQSEESFRRYFETFGQNQSGDGSFGWLAVVMPGYKRTKPGEALEHLKCDVEWQGGDQRPLIQVQECDHPLYRDQRDGISWERAIELAMLMMHPD